jgi:AmiR/NasT family two-component response regulator
MSNQQDVGVLIAEDDCLNSEMIKGLLEEIGYTVVGEARDGLETVEMTQSLQPNVILMDIKMPDMDGLEATQRIQECCPTPVVVLTAYETPELVEEASVAGVGAYLIKPPDAREMERAICIAMARFDDLMEMRHLNAELQDTLGQIRTLSGLLPICSHCKKVRDDEGYWDQIEAYIQEHSDVMFSHGLCPECAKKLYPEIFGGEE